MTNENKLERIFWKDSKWVDSNGNEVKPEPIGEPHDQMCPYVTTESRLTNEILDFLIKKDKKYEEANSYSIHSLNDSRPESLHETVTAFYKIIR
jgi:hypothetical protein